MLPRSGCNYPDRGGELYDQPLPMNEEDETWTDCSPTAGETHDICCIPECDPMSIGCCYIKDYSEVNNDHFFAPALRDVCIGQNFPAPVDPIEDWEFGNYPTIDEEIREHCSLRCSNDQVQVNGIAPAVCEDDQWSSLQTHPDWAPEDGFNCNVTMELNQDDPDGSEVPWELVGGPTTPFPLDCDLNGDCVDWFYPHVAAFVLTPGSGDFIEPETRTAHYLAVESSGSNIEIEVDATGSGAGVDDTEPVFGQAEYTAVECGDLVCPFFLANVSAYNTTDVWDVMLYSGDPNGIKKLVSDVQIDLMQSTLGVRHMIGNYVAFAPGALRLRVQVTIDSVSPNSSFGDGTHATIVENDEYVFAEYNDGALSLTHTFVFQCGEATLNIDVVPDEHPPVAEHDLNATEACDHASGLVLDASHITSTDPDDDIVVDMWWIDGFPCGSECVLPFGTHEVSIEARDARGAVDRTADETIVVTSGC